MSRFFVGQRVRVVRSYTGLGYGREARITGRGFVAEWTLDVDGLPPRAGLRTWSANSDQLEPILPEGHQPSEFASLTDLLDSLGVPA